MSPIGAAVPYDVQGFSGQPAQLATIGLDMYGYERDFGATPLGAGAHQLCHGGDGQPLRIRWRTQAGVLTDTPEAVELHNLG
ncbi:hypothetical protein [Gordonia malaquae]|uniref:hypothetical protein n=1 Tax=Gordonia malaquae TaxID=410332 RepID=UPI0030FEB021